MKTIAPAKINLFLHITGRREDGYHLLDSLFAFTHWGDEITVQEAQSLSLTIDGPYAQSLSSDSVEKNLVLRATQLLQKKYYVTENVAIHLTKNIPVGAGLGGGSSDAAAILKTLNHFWKLNIDEKTLGDIGLSLGADVPACLHGKTALISGIGEKIFPVNVALPMFIVLINPNELLSTQKVFQQYQQLRTNYTPCMILSIKTVEDLKNTRNDLTIAAIRLLPCIGNILKTVSAQFGCISAAMSGSGPTCFGLFDDDISAKNAVKALTDIFPNYFVAMTKFKTAQPAQCN